MGSNPTLSAEQDPGSRAGVLRVRAVATRMGPDRAGSAEKSATPSEGCPGAAATVSSAGSAAKPLVLWGDWRLTMR